LPGVERRDVNLELVERRRRRAHYLADTSPVVGFRVGGRPLVDGRLLHVLLRDQRGEGADGGNRCDDDDELNGLHGAQGTPTRRFAVRFAAWTRAGGTPL